MCGARAGRRGSGVSECWSTQSPPKHWQVAPKSWPHSTESVGYDPGVLLVGGPYKPPYTSTMFALPGHTRDVPAPPDTFAALRATICLLITRGGSWGEGGGELQCVWEGGRGGGGTLPVSIPQHPWAHSLLLNPPPSHTHPTTTTTPKTPPPPRSPPTPHMHATLSSKALPSPLPTPHPTTAHLCLVAAQQHCGPLQLEVPRALGVKLRTAMARSVARQERPRQHVQLTRGHGA